VYVCALYHDHPIFFFTCAILYSDDWVKFTDYRGYTSKDEVIQRFWKCVRSWPPERKSRLLQFATGASRIPPSGLQGSDGPRRFTIEDSDDPSQFPMGHARLHRIDLPRSIIISLHMNLVIVRRRDGRLQEL